MTEPAADRPPAQLHLQLAALIEQLTEGVIALDRAGNALIFNQAALAMHGFTDDRPRAELRYDAFRAFLDYRSLDGEVLPENDWPPNRVLRGDSFTSCEVMLRRTDTDLTRWISYNGAQLRDDGHAGDLAILTMRDITAQKESEAALRRRATEYRALFELAGVAKTEADMVTGRYLRVNRKYCEFTGYSEPELLAMSLDDLLFPEDQATNGARIARVLAGERGNLTFERRYRRKDGSVAWGLVNLAFVEDETGQLRSIATIQDIGERKRAEAERRRSEERMRIALTNSAVTVYAQDRDLRYTFMYYSALGDSPDRAIGHTDEEMVAADDAARLTTLKRSVLATGEPVRAEVRVTERGVRRFFDLSVEPLRGADDTIVGVTGAAVDITERKQREQRDRLLVQAGQVLGTSLDADAALGAITDLLVPTLADWCVVSTVDGDWIERRAARHVEPEGQAFLEALVPRYRLDSGRGRGIARVIATGVSIYLPQGSLADDPADHDPDIDLRIARGVAGAVSQIVVPLATRGRVFGAINACLGPGERRFDRHDLALFEELAQRAALALENARYYTVERAAREIAERANARAARLQEATAALSSALTLDDVARVTVEACMATVGAVGGAITLVRPGDQQLEMRHAVGYPDEVVNPRLLLPLDHPTPRAIVARTGEPIWLDSPEEAVRRYPDSVLTTVVANGQLSWAFVPLLAGGQCLGSLLFSFARPYALDEADRASLLALAGLCAQSFARARLYEGEQATRSRLQQILEVMPDAVLGVDADGSFAYANDTAIDVLGFNPVGQALPLAGAGAFGLFGTRRTDGTPYRDNDLPLQRAYLHGETVLGEPMTVRNASTGAEVPVLVSAAPLRDAAGSIDGALVAFQDITALKALERIRDDFYTAVSHDLKNPLTVIRAHMQLLQRQLGKLDMTFAAPYVERLGSAIGATDRMNQLLADLLDHARLQSGQALDLAPQPTDLVALIRRLVAEWDRLGGQHRFVVSASAESIILAVDPRRFERVLENLVSNATKYSPEGSEIALSIAVEHASADPHVAISVRDSGVGIPADDLPYVSQPYRRGSNVRGQFTGSGLGLANARQLTEQHGGSLEVESEEGHGTVVRLRLPWR